MTSGAYDGSNRDDYFQGVVGRRRSLFIVTPGRRESGEPGIHTTTGLMDSGQPLRGFRNDRVHSERLMKPF